MKKMLAMTSSAALAAALLSFALPAMADTIGPINFESYPLGSINGVDGWTATGSAGSGCATYDEGVIANSTIPTAPTSFGAQSFRISNAVTSGCFSDQAFSKPLVNAAGETGADLGTFTSGPLQPHFESTFDIYAIPGSTGDDMSVSPDRGDGARMSYLRFENPGDGLIHVYFDDVTDPSHGTNDETFNEYQIAQLPVGTAHTVKFSMDLLDGPDNDVVTISIDGTQVFTGTSWEDYYLYDTESNPGLTDNHSRAIRTMLFRAGGDAVPGNLGKGYLIDNLTLSSGATPAVAPVASCPTGTTQSATPLETVTVNSSQSTPTSSVNKLTNGQSYLVVSSGTWQNGAINVADTAFESLTNWLTHTQGYNVAPNFLGPNEFELMVNNAFVNWGAYNSSHSYSYLATGTGSKASFMVFDGNSNSGPSGANPSYYVDNSGNLSVKIYSCTLPKTTTTTTTTTVTSTTSSSASTGGNVVVGNSNGGKGNTTVQTGSATSVAVTTVKAATVTVVTKKK